jgi:hypothetical protein
MRPSPVVVVAAMAACSRSGPAPTSAPVSAATVVIARTEVDPPRAPRPVSPSSGGRVTSRRPPFRFRLAERTDGARVEVCRDRACGTVLLSLDAAGETVVPPDDLPPGRVYWRLRGRRGELVGSETSATWPLVVSPRSAPVTTTWGAASDVDGDGYADLVVGAGAARNGTGRVYVYQGGSSGVATSPTLVLEAPDGPNSTFGYAVQVAGDVDGDGYVDILVGATGADDGKGRVYLYRGGPHGLERAPTYTMRHLEKGGIGSVLSGNIDVDGDGFADVVIGAPHGHDDRTGCVYVYHGAPGGFSTTLTDILCEPLGAAGRFGTGVAGVGDVDGDGYGDIVVGSDQAHDYGGRIDLFLGSARGLQEDPAASIRGTHGRSFFGGKLARAGDVDGDGYADVIVGAPNAKGEEGAADVFLGGPGGLSATRVVPLQSLDGAAGIFGYAVAGIGDVDGDGYDDVAVGSECGPAAARRADGSTPCGPGRFHVYRGGPRGPSHAPTLSGTRPDDRDMIFALGAPGDLDGDGFDDFLVTSPSSPATGRKITRTNDGPGRVYLHPGSRLGPSLTAALVLTGPDGLGGWFGVSIAGR